MKAYTLTLTEKRNKSKGLKLTLFIHLSLIALSVIPFLIQQDEPVAELQMIFLDFSSGSSNEGAKEEIKLDEAKAATTAEKQAQPEMQPEVQESKPIMTTENDEIQIEAVEEEQVEVIEEIPEVVEEEIQEEVTEEIVEEVVEKPVDPEVSTEAEVSEKGGSGANGQGEKGDGKNDQGNAKNGNGKGFIEGNGVLERKIIHYADLKEIIKTNGKLVMKICINRYGIVTYIEYDEENSTIKDKELARKAIDVVANYRFAKDYKAAMKECGRLTYYFEVD